METKPFNQKALEALFDCALAYSKLLPFDYKITSNEFKERQEYSIRFHEGNFLHLTGVRTKLSASDFYKKAISRELRLNDFDCSSSHSLKGIVRIKIRNLRSINTFFDDCALFVEYARKSIHGAEMDIRKCDYLLTFSKDSDKSKFLETLGYSLSAPGKLRTDILCNTNWQTLTFSSYLKQCFRCIAQTNLNGKLVTTVWELRKDFTLRFLTLIPGGDKKW